MDRRGSVYAPWVLYSQVLAVVVVVVAVGVEVDPACEAAVRGDEGDAEAVARLVLLPATRRAASARLARLSVVSLRRHQSRPAASPGQSARTGFGLHSLSAHGTGGCQPIDDKDFSSYLACRADERPGRPRGGRSMTTESRQHKGGWNGKQHQQNMETRYSSLEKVKSTGNPRCLHGEKSLPHGMLKLKEGARGH